MHRGTSAAIVVRRAPDLPGRERGTRGTLRLGPVVLPCALGRSGIRAFKREGDGATPVGHFPILRGMVRGDRPLAAVPMMLPSRRIRRREGWSDDPLDPAYNRAVRLPRRRRAEDLWRDDRLYDVVIVLDYNVTRRARWRGSAVFWHVAQPGLGPTEGCIALSTRDMARVIPHLRRRQALIVSG